MRDDQPSSHRLPFARSYASICAAAEVTGEPIHRNSRDALIAEQIGRVTRGDLGIPLL